VTKLHGPGLSIPTKALLGRSKRICASRREFLMSTTAMAIAVASSPAMSYVGVGFSSPELREVVLYTIATGISLEPEHRILELGCVELINRQPTGRTYHQNVNQICNDQRTAIAENGVTIEFLSDCPMFADIVDELLSFVGDSPLVTHDADRHIGLINAEISRLGRSSLHKKRVVDTASLAERRFPGAQVSIRALCKRFDIYCSTQDFPYALSGAQTLAKIYPLLVSDQNRRNTI